MKKTEAVVEAVVEKAPEVAVGKAVEIEAVVTLEEIKPVPANEATTPRSSRPRAHNDPREKRRREKAAAEQDAAKEG